VWFGPSITASEERELMSFLGAHNGVAILCWPRDSAHLEHLAQVVSLNGMLRCHGSGRRSDACPHSIPTDGLDQYAAEPKLDGWRVTVGVEPGAVTVRTCRGPDHRPVFG
jgi:hypothetical protein